MEKTDALYLAAKHYTNGGTGLWAQFGKLEAELELDSSLDKVRERKQTFAMLENLVIKKTQQRAEPRSLTLLHLTGVLCMLGQGKKASEIAGPLAMLRQAFANVDGSLTIYSQFWKTNVNRSVFEADDFGRINALMVRNETEERRLPS